MKVDMLVIFSDSLLIANSRVPGNKGCVAYCQCFTSLMFAEHGIILPLPLTNITREGFGTHKQMVSPKSRKRLSSSLLRPPKPVERHTATLKFRYTAPVCLKYYRNYYSTDSKAPGTSAGGE